MKVYVTENKLRICIRELLLKHSNKLNEALTDDDYNEIVKIIRLELSAIFYDLYRKRGLWV